MASEHVYDIGRVADLYGAYVTVGVDHDAVTIDAPYGTTLHAEVRDDFARLYFEADTKAKAHAAAVHAAAIEEERLEAADIAADRRDRLDID